MCSPRQFYRTFKNLLAEYGIRALLTPSRAEIAPSYQAGCLETLTQ